MTEFDTTPTPNPTYDSSKVPAEIRKIANYVRTKYKGEDILEAVAQSSEIAGLIANEALEAQAYDGNSLADVTLAKDGLPTLDARIRRDVNNLENKKADKSEVTAQLAQKVDKGNVSVSDINKNLGKLDQTFMSEDFLQQIAGNTPINAVPADGSLTTEKYADKSITSGKVEYIIEPTNLFEVGRYEASFDPETWYIISNPEYCISPPIYVNPGKEYVIHTAGMGRVLAYNKDNGAIKMTVIEPTDEQVVYVPNQNTSYIQVQTKIENIGETQVNKGAVLLPYSKYFVPKIDTSKVNVFGDYMSNDGEEF